MEMTEAEFEEISGAAFRLGLCGKELLTRAGYGEAVVVCNGIGPSWFPAKLRGIIDRLHPSLKVVAMIHDLWYYYGDGSSDDFHRANRAFAENGKKTAKETYKWWNPVRYKAMHDAVRFAGLCDAFGRSAYYAAIGDRKAREAME